MSIVKTRFEGEERPHILLWSIVEQQARIARKRQRDWSGPALIAMVFAFHTIEGYVNFVGEHLAPEIWRDEENYFRKQPPPYRGWKGKLRTLLELVDLSWLPEDRPLKTILELKDLRDAIVHAKTEYLSGEHLHLDDTEAPFAVSQLRSRFTPKERFERAVADVGQLAECIHTMAAPRLKLKSAWCGEEALHGPISYTTGTTQLVDDIA